MNRCEHFKELILTDYIDGRLDKKAADLLEGHFMDCGDCRAFYKQVKETLSPFHQSSSQRPVPPQLWEAVRQGIERQEHGFLEVLLNGLKTWLVFPRLVPVLATLVIMLLAGGVSLNTIQVNRAQEKEQGEYLASLIGSAGTTMSAESNNFGTPIEQYFL